MTVSVFARSFRHLNLTFVTSPLLLNQFAMKSPVVFHISLEKPCSNVFVSNFEESCFLAKLKARRTIPDDDLLHQRSVDAFPRVR